MSLKRDYITHACKKMKSGPGGWYCSCCNPYGTNPRKMKPLARRRIRHMNKQLLYRTSE